MSRFAVWVLLLLAAVSLQAEGSSAACDFGASESACVEVIYQRTADALLWTSAAGASGQARQLIDVLANARSYGLQPEDYSAARIAADYAALSRAGATSDAERQRLDRELSMAAVRLLWHLHYGRVDPLTAGFELPKRTQDLDTAAAVLELAQTKDVGAAIAHVEPGFYHYALLKQALHRYQGLAYDPTLSPLPMPHKTLRLGDTYGGVVLLRHWLRSLGDQVSAPSPAESSDRIDRDLVDALKRFQARHDLPMTGALDPATYRALSTPLTQRIRQIELTLERWRWVPAFDRPPIIVNLPEFRLFALKDTQDRVADMIQMPVIVGRAFPATRTPVFVGELQFVVFRPHWDVPSSIARRELLPAERRNPRYFEQHQFEIVGGASEDAPILPMSSLALDEVAAGRARIRQRPGGENALGMVKFVFPNQYSIYLHDTPARELFAFSRRDFSHGCIRVSDPVALAQFALRNNSEGWDEAKITAAMHGQQTVWVKLARSLPVMIVYGTAMATESGQIQFFEDIYGYDRALEHLLRSDPFKKVAPGDEPPPGA